MKLRRATPCLVCTWLSYAAPCLEAQDGRIPLRGEVVGVDNAPWPGAEVRLFWLPFPGFDVGLADEVSVAADDRGQFEAALLPGREYSAWATFTHGDATDVTELAEGVTPGRFLTLRASKHEHPPIRVHVQGCIQYRPRQPLSLSLELEGSRFPAWQDQIESDRSVAIPAIPGDLAILVVRGREGHPIAERDMPLVRAAWERARKKRETLNDNDQGILKGWGEKVRRWKERLEIERSRDRPDPAGIEQIEDAIAHWSASIRLLEWRMRQRVAMDFEDPVVTLPSRRDPKPDLPRSRWYDPPKVGQVSGSVLFRRGEPASALPIVLVNNQRIQVTRTDAQGRFRFEDVPASRPVHLLAVVPPSAADELRTGRGAQPIVWLCGPRTLSSETQIDTGELALSELRAVDVRVVDAHGAPAEHASLRARAAGVSGCLPLRAVTDHSGRSCIRIPKEGEFEVAAVCGGDGAFGYAAIGVESVVRIGVEPMIHLEGKVLSARLRPVPEASVRIGLVEGVVQTHVASLFTQLFPERSRTLTGGDGAFGLSVPADANPLRLVAYYAPRSSEAETVIDPRDLPGRIEIVLP